LIDWVGRDAARFFLAQRRADAEFIFDIDLAHSQTEENPVYYVHYAHARICSVLAQTEETASSLATADPAPPIHPHELPLLRRLAQYPALLTQASQELAPHQLAFWLRDCAADFHTWYNSNRILVEDTATQRARLRLATATRQVLANGLHLL